MSRPRQETLVLCGGGVKGLVFLSTLTYLEENGYLEHMKNYYGTSVGAIIALLVATRIPVNQISRLLNSLESRHLLSPNFQELLNQITPYSAGGTSRLETLIQSILTRRYGNAHITLREFYDETGTTLNFIAVDLIHNLSVNLNRHLFPNMTVTDAVMASAALPGVFDPVQQRNLFFVDGGIHENYPISFVPPQDLPYTIGLYIQDHLGDTHQPQTPSEPWNPYPGEQEDEQEEEQLFSQFFTTFHQFSRILQCFYTSVKKSKWNSLSQSQRQRTLLCRMPFHTDSSNFWLTDAQKTQLSNSPLDPRIHTLYPPLTEPATVNEHNRFRRNSFSFV